MWTKTQYGWEIEGKHCTILMEPRPHYCDRGNWLAYLELKPDTDPRDLNIDYHDLWPRYYFDEGRAKLEIEAWLKKRKEWVENGPDREVPSMQQTNSA